MRQVLIGIPIDGPWSLGPLGEVPGFGLGLVLLIWGAFGGYWLYANRKDLAADAATISPIVVWAVVAVVIFLLPRIVQRRAHATIADTTQALERLKPGSQQYEAAFSDRDRAWRKLRDPQSAIAASEAEVKRRSEETLPRVRLAWVLATTPDDAARDPERAKSLLKTEAETLSKTMESISISNAGKRREAAAVFDAYGAALAANGEFDAAIAQAKLAAEQAGGVPIDESDDVGQLIAIRKRIESYQNERPYRDQQVGVSVPIYGYGLMLFLGFASAGWMAIRRASWVGIEKDTIWDVSLWVLIGGIGGARLFYVVQYRDTVFKGKSTFVEYAWAFLNLREGGLVLYGGVCVALVAYLYFCYRKKLNVLLMSDVVIPSFFIGLAFGRLGCFMNGCCYGDRCDLPWGVTFPLGSVPDIALVNRGFVQAGDLFTLQLHPSQLYSSLNALILAVLTHLYFKVRHRDGAVLGLALLTYPVTRFLIEYLRGDEMGKFDTPLTISQYVSLVLFGIGAIYMVWLTRRAGGVTPLAQAPTSKSGEVPAAA